MEAFGLDTGTPIVIYLHSPKEKVWGLLVSLTPRASSCTGWTW
jgi:hypothetical protein